MKAIAVIGAGTTGAGVAQLAAAYGCTAYLIDVNAEVLRRSAQEIRGNLDRAAATGLMTAAGRDAMSARIQTRGEIGDLKDVDLAIEAVVEDLAIKQEVFRNLDAQTPPSALLATTTSLFSVTNIAEAARNPARVIGMHFSNPAPVMPLVEIIAGKKSDATSVDAGFAIAAAWGKTAVRATDTPGFIVNRISLRFHLEAIRLLGEGVAGVDEIDHVMRTHVGFKMGPFELMDRVGLDVVLAGSTSVWERMERHARFMPHEIHRRLVERGQLGRKSGRGFHAYEADAPPLPAYIVDRRSFRLSPLLSGAACAFAERAGARSSGSTEQYVLARILSATLNEAALTLGEGVASRGDIDLAMQKGADYPKGPLAWIDEIGPRTVRGVLKALNESTGDNRYAAAKSITEAW